MLLSDLKNNDADGKSTENDTHVRVWKKKQEKEESSVFYREKCLLGFLDDEVHSFKSGQKRNSFRMKNRQPCEMGRE